ncbi:hypothetical protein FA013_28405 [Raoultella planticola]|nr:hypothetical protein FA013_28405 [Raoultella planticola]
MMSLWDALRMNMMISYQELVRTFLSRVEVAMAMQEKYCTHATTLLREKLNKGTGIHSTV